MLFSTKDRGTFGFAATFQGRSRVEGGKTSGLHVYENVPGAFSVVLLLFRCSALCDILRARAKKKQI